MAIRKSIMERFEDGIERIPFSGCWIWIKCTDKDGYGVIQFTRQARRAHRVSWALHCGEIPDGFNVLHRCDIPYCVNPDHLFLGTASDNVSDKVSKGRIRIGSNHANSKLTEEIVRQVFALKEKGIKGRVIATMFGVKEAAISAVLHGRNWSHVILDSTS